MDLETAQPGLALAKVCNRRSELDNAVQATPLEEFKPGEISSEALRGSIETKEKLLFASGTFRGALT